jgi:transcription initiation factor TFIIE subunit alpha
MFGMRPTTKTYYFIHFTEAIDGIKWKVHQVVQSIQKDLNADADPQGYICPVCKTKYSQLDAVALLNFEKNEFVCSLCDVVLIEDDSGKIAKENQVKYSKLMKQLEPLINYLRKIDEHTVMENNFETSLEKMLPAVATTTASYTVSNLRKNQKMFDKNSYLNNTSSMVAGARSQATLHVNISTGDDDLQREKQLIEQEEKRKQNALPSWHEESTIGKSLGKLDQDEEDIEVEVEPNEEMVQDSEIKTEPEQSSDTNTNELPSTATEKDQGIDPADKETQEALAAYYARLDRNAKDEEDEEDEEEEEEEEDEFEDVEVETPMEALVESQKDVVVEELEFSDEE